MRIFVNATSVRLGGGITVIRNLLPAFVEVDGGAHEYHVIARRDVLQSLDPGHPRVKMHVSDLGGRSGFTRVLWEQLALPIRAMASGGDVLLSPAGVAVFGSPVPQVLVFQNMAPFDPNVVHRAAGTKRLRLEVLKHLGIVSARAVRRVVFISRYAQRSILPQLGIRGLNTACVYLGRDPAFGPEAAERADDLLSAHGIRRPYVLSVSQFYHYKNFVELVQGFARAAPRLPPGTQLVIAGAEHEVDYAAEVRATIAREGIDDQVRILGQVPYGELPPLYAAARLFVFPSTCENFPNILVEGLASAVPTISSRLGPMQEVAGEGAAYFDPYDPDDVARALVAHFHDGAARERLVAAGVAQAAQYDWADTARRLLGILEQAAR